MVASESADTPMAWLWAEHAAGELITRVDGPVSPATFEFRATRDVLALTLLFTGHAGAAASVSASHLESIQDHLTVDSRWMAWCRSRLNPTDTTRTEPNLSFARNAWQWLARQMLPALQQAEPTCGEPAALHAQAACRTGLNHARRIIQAHLTQPS